MPIKVHSEIGKLKKVVLHRPGAEVENLTPDTFEELLFDDSMYLKVAQEEHDAFADTLRKNGVEVFYIEQLAADAISQSAEIKKEFIAEFVKDAIKSKEDEKPLTDYLSSIKDNKQLIDECIAGIRYKTLNISEEGKDVHVFISDPLPNVLFTRDNWASMGNGITLNKMFTETRNREVIFGKFVFKYNPEYKDTVKWFDKDIDGKEKGMHIEGGDELILSDKALAIGISLRTSRDAVMKVAKNIFADDNENYEAVYGFHIPVGRAWMHLDTVFTQIDKDKFTIYTNKSFVVEKFTPDGKGGVKVEKLEKEMTEILKDIFGRDITLIKCGNGDVIDGNREQWNDGSNSLAVAPNHLIVYSRNHVTVDLLIASGVKVDIIPSSELSRGRGGPRCMSMPLEREAIDWSK